MFFSPKRWRCLPGLQGPSQRGAAAACSARLLWLQVCSKAAMTPLSTVTCRRVGYSSLQRDMTSTECRVHDRIMWSLNLAKELATFQGAKRQERRHTASHIQ